MAEYIKEEGKTISDDRKMNLIAMIILARVGTDFTMRKDGILTLATTKEETDFIENVYKQIEEYSKTNRIDGREDEEALKSHLYDVFQIAKEAIERRAEKQENSRQEFRQLLEQDRRDKERRARAHGMELNEGTGMVITPTDTLSQEQTGNGEQSSVNDDDRLIDFAQLHRNREKQQAENLQSDLTIQREEELEQENKRYKENLYKPGFLCGRSISNPNKPFVKLIGNTKATSMRDTATTFKYQFADKSYEIKQIGKLVYMPRPNEYDSIPEYEITIAQGNEATTVRRFGEISFNRMSDPEYSTVVFLGLLGQSNLYDKELYGYLGHLQPQKKQTEDGRIEEYYKVVHVSEEYTAVAIWEEIANKKENKKDEQEQDVTQMPRGNIVGDER